MKTIYEASPVSLFMLVPLLALTIGVIGVRRAFYGGVRWFERVFACIWLVVWVSVWSFAFVQLVAVGVESRSALRRGQCKVVEGIVEVLHRGNPGGHDGGDRIRIGTNEFEIEPGIWANAMCYHQLIARGGALTNGAYTRLNVLGAHILKVEIKS